RSYAGSDCTLLQLTQQPGNIVHAAHGGVVGNVVVAIDGSPLLVVAAEKIAVPAVFLRANHHRAGIDGLDHGAVFDHLVADLGHVRSYRMHIAVRAEPDTVLVI